jgi:hypothetical protein
MENAEPTQKPKEIHLSDHIGFLQGLDLDRADSTGQVVEDQTYREDARRYGTIRTEHTAEGKRLDVSGAHRDGRVNTRADKKAEENEAAAAFANDWSERAGKVYFAELKEVETGRFPDVWISEQGAGEGVWIEFTHFDEAAISQLEREGQYGPDELTVDKIGQNICNAIDLKNSKLSKSPAKVNLARKAFLVLISPFPIRPSLYGAIAEKVATLPVDKLFMETRVLPLKQKPFRVQ